MATRESSDLQAQLAAQRAKSSPELTATVAAGAQRLIESGIAQQVLRPGALAPDFTLPDALGKPVALTALLAQGPVAVTFYRGEWCPYCNLQLHAYQAIMPQIQELGATLVAISPQLPDHSLSMVEKHQLSFPVLSDVGNQVARQFGLVYTTDDEMRAIQAGFGMDMRVFNGDDTWELPLPGTFIIAPDRAVRFAYVNADFRERLEPAELVAQLRAISTTQQ